MSGSTFFVIFSGMDCTGACFCLVPLATAATDFDDDDDDVLTDDVEGAVVVDLAVLNEDDESVNKKIKIH